jgi:hypothetical protein
VKQYSTNDSRGRDFQMPTYPLSRAPTAVYAFGQSATFVARLLALLTAGSDMEVPEAHWLKSEMFKVEIYGATENRFGEDSRVIVIQRELYGADLSTYITINMTEGTLDACSMKNGEQSQFFGHPLTLIERPFELLRPACFSPVYALTMFWDIFESMLFGIDRFC